MYIDVLGLDLASHVAVDSVCKRLASTHLYVRGDKRAVQSNRTISVMSEKFRELRTLTAVVFTYKSCKEFHIGPSDAWGVGVDQQR